MRSYEAARSLFSFLAFCAWSMVVIGVIAAMIGGGSVSQYSSSGAGLLAALPGLAMAFFGLFQVAIIQNARATVDTAEYTQQMLKIARDQLEVSKQSLNQNNASSTGFTDQKSKPKSRLRDVGYSSATTKSESDAKPMQDRTSMPIEKSDEQNSHLGKYKGKSIEEKRGKFICNGIPFDTMDKAKNYVDNFTSTPSKTLPGVKRS